MSDTQQVTAQYTWSSGVPPVSAGAFQSDSRNWSAATELYFSNADSQSQDLTNTFGTLALDDTLRVEQGGNPGNWRVWRVTAAATQEADLSWSVPVESLASGGTNVSNNQPCYVVFTLALTPEQSLADWTMLQDPAHWYSVVQCVHGTTRNGVWLNQPIQDDRNFLAMAGPTFVNHQSLHVDCDCVLNIAWSPSYVPPAPAQAALSGTASSSERPKPDPLAGGATFDLWSMYPALYGGLVQCQHGWFQSGIHQGVPGWPNLQVAQVAAYENHQRIFGCGDSIGLPPAANTAGVTFPQQTNIAADASVALQQVSVAPGAPFDIDGFGRLNLAQAALLTVSATFYLANSGVSSVFAALRLPDAATPDLTAPSVQTVGLSDDNGYATASLSWSGQVPANTSFEVDLWNGSGLIQDIQGGSLTVTIT
jgi:hypothetical protein